MPEINRQAIKVLEFEMLPQPFTGHPHQQAITWYVSYFSERIVGYTLVSQSLLDDTTLNFDEIIIDEVFQWLITQQNAPIRPVQQRKLLRLLKQRISQQLYTDLLSKIPPPTVTPIGSLIRLSRKTLHK